MTLVSPDMQKITSQPYVYTKTGEMKFEVVRLRKKKRGFEWPCRFFLASGVSSDYIFKLSSVATRALF